MSFIHFRGLLHRDLKPANVLVDAQWVAKVADFGTATLEEAAADETASGAPDEGINGTPPYMAPEVLTGRRYDTPVDVWAYGCVLAHMGSGRVPYSQLGLTKAAALFDECAQLWGTSQGADHEWTRGARADAMRVRAAA